MLVLKYRRRPWANIFVTDIFRCINTYIKVVCLTFLGIFMLIQMCVSKILVHRLLWYFKTAKILQKWLQTWFILLHLALLWNVCVKSIWTNSLGGALEASAIPVLSCYYLKKKGTETGIDNLQQLCPPPPPPFLTFCHLLAYNLSCCKQGVPTYFTRWIQTWWFLKLKIDFKSPILTVFGIA